MTRRWRTMCHPLEARAREARGRRRTPTLPKGHCQHSCSSATMSVRLPRALAVRVPAWVRLRRSLGDVGRYKQTRANWRPRLPLTEKDMKRKWLHTKARSLGLLLQLPRLRKRMMRRRRRKRMTSEQDEYSSDYLDTSHLANVLTCNPLHI